MLFFLLVFSLSSCLKDIDDVGVDTNPFDPDYGFPMAIVENISIKDTTISGATRCFVETKFQIDATTLERINNITSIEAENIKFLLRFREFGNNSNLLSPKEIINYDLDELKTDRTYTARTPVWWLNCGDEICLEFLYEDQRISNTVQSNSKESAIQKLDCFVIAL